MARAQSVERGSRLLTVSNCLYPGQPISARSLLSPGCWQAALG